MWKLKNPERSVFCPTPHIQLLEGRICDVSIMLPQYCNIIISMHITINSRLLSISNTDLDIHFTTVLKFPLIT